MNSPITLSPSESSGAAQASISSCDSATASAGVAKAERSQTKPVCCRAEHAHLTPRLSPETQPRRPTLSSTVMRPSRLPLDPPGDARVVDHEPLIVKLNVCREAPGAEADTP